MSSAQGYSPKRVVVFGGIRFLGSHVADSLTDAGSTLFFIRSHL